MFPAHLLITSLKFTLYKCSINLFMYTLASHFFGSSSYHSSFGSLINAMEKNIQATSISRCWSSILKLTINYGIPIDDVRFQYQLKC